MTFGFKSFNDAGTLQIDDTYKNLQLRSKSSVNTGSLGGSLGNISYGSFTLDLTYPPVIAFQDSTGITCNNGISSTYLGGGVTRYTIGLMVLKPNTTNYNVNYFVFGPPQTEAEAPLPPIGLVTRDTSGTVVYRSDQKYFNIVDVVSLASPTGTSGSSSTNTYASGRNFAVVTSSFATFATYVLNAYPIFITTYEYTGGFNVVSNVVTAKWQQYGTINGQPYGTVTDTLRGIVLDVTNF